MTSPPPNTAAESAPTPPISVVLPDDPQEILQDRSHFDPWIVCSLFNLGNTCFANAALQAIANLPHVATGLRFGTTLPVFQLRRMTADPAAAEGPAAGGDTSTTSSSDPACCTEGGGQRAVAIVISAAAAPSVSSRTARLSKLGGVNAELDSVIKRLASHNDLRSQTAVLLANTLERMEVATSPYQYNPISFIRHMFACHEEFTLGDQHDSVEWMSAALDYADEPYCMEMHAPVVAAALGAVGGGQSSQLGSAVVNEEPPNGGGVYDGDAAASSWHSREPPVVQGAVSAASRSSALVYRIIAAVDRANAEETFVEKFKRKPRDSEELTAFQTDSGEHASLRLHRSPVVDAFRGLQLSEIRCHECAYTSRCVSEYSALQLAFPTVEQRAKYREFVKRAFVQHRQTVTEVIPASLQPMEHNDPLSDEPSASGPSGHSLNDVDAGSGLPPRGGAPSATPKPSISSRLYSAFSRFCSSFGGSDGGPVTLEEMLWVYFQPELLSGTNKYKCSNCHRLSDATKQLCLLTVPDVLTISLKRFSAGYWNSKIHSCVDFPLNFRALSEDDAHRIVNSSSGRPTSSSPPRPAMDGPRGSHGGPSLASPGRPPHAAAAHGAATPSAAQSWTALVNQHLRFVPHAATPWTYIPVDYSHHHDVNKPDQHAVGCPKASVSHPVALSDALPSTATATAVAASHGNNASGNQKPLSKSELHAAEQRLMWNCDPGRLLWWNRAVDPEWMSSRSSHWDGRLERTAFLSHATPVPRSLGDLTTLTVAERQGSEPHSARDAAKSTAKIEEEAEAAAERFLSQPPADRILSLLPFMHPSLRRDFRVPESSSNHGSPSTTSMAASFCGGVDSTRPEPNVVADGRRSAPFSSSAQMDQALPRGAPSSSSAVSASIAALPPDSVFTYSLDSVINHHGTFSHGHYTAYAFKGPKEEDGRWMRFDDERSKGNIAAEVVADSQAYVLVYTRKPICDESKTVRAPLREMARRYLINGGGSAPPPPPPPPHATAAGGSSAPEDDPTAAAGGLRMAPLQWPAASTATTFQDGASTAGNRATGGVAGPSDVSHSPTRVDSSPPRTASGRDPHAAGAVVAPSGTDVVYVSRLWLLRVANFVEPGPLTNSMCYCAPHRRRTHQFAGRLGAQVMKTASGAVDSRRPAVETSDDGASTGGGGRTRASLHPAAMQGSDTELCSTYGLPSATDLAKNSTASDGDGGADDATSSLAAPDAPFFHIHTSARWFYLPVAISDYRRWVNVFGGGPMVTSEQYTSLLQREDQWLRRLQNADETTGSRR